jgi:hypothetical protein
MLNNSVSKTELNIILCLCPFSARPILHMTPTGPLFLQNTYFSTYFGMVCTKQGLLLNSSVSITSYLKRNISEI